MFSANSSSLDKPFERSHLHTARSILTRILDLTAIFQRRANLLKYDATMWGGFYSADPLDADEL